MDSPGPADLLLAAHLATGETLHWSERPGPSRAGPRELKSALVPGVAAGLLVAFITSSAELPSFVPLLALVLVAGGVTWMFYSAHGLPGSALYAVTDQRLLIVDGGKLRAFRPGEVTYLNVEPYSDGTVDLVWGDDSPAPRDRRRAGQPKGKVSAQFSIKQRRFKRGFLGLASAEPAHSLIRALKDKEQRQAAAHALGIPAPAGTTDTAGSSTTRVGIDTPGAATQGWRTLREPETGFAVDVPAAWETQLTRLRTFKVLGLPISPAPKWSDTPFPGWNQLKTDTGLEDALLQVSLNPVSMPTEVDSVLNDRWAKALNLKAIDSNPDVRIGELAGFSVTHDLHGVGPQVGVGPLKAGFGSIKAQLLQTQLWLRGPKHAVHVQIITPTHATDLRAAIQRVVATLRFEGG